VEFTGVAMNPGKPQGFGRIGDVPIFTLPGNPVSSFVSFEVFVRPAIRRMRGITPECAPLHRAVLTEAMSSPSGKRQYARGWVSPAGDGALPTVRPAGGAGSHLLGGLAGANCFIVFDTDVTSAAAGSTVSIMLLDGGLV
ncbi:MAG TPA: molybdopterin-binding protein, partial [Sporichthyaceae bacterium]